MIHPSSISATCRIDTEAQWKRNRNELLDIFRDVGTQTEFPGGGGDNMTRIKELENLLNCERRKATERERILINQLNAIRSQNNIP